MIPAGKMTMKNGRLVENFIAESPHLSLVESNVFDIPRRIREYDPTYFVVRNHRRGKFEIHNIENGGSTYCFTVPTDELDSRVIELVKTTDTKAYGAEVLIDKFYKDLEAQEEERKRKTKRFAEDMARDLAGPLQRALLAEV